MRPLALGLLLFMAWLSAVVAGDGPLRYPGTDWTLVPPDGFALVPGPDAALANGVGATITMTQWAPRPHAGGGFDTLGKVVGEAPFRARIVALKEERIGGVPARRADMEMIDQPGEALVYVLDSPDSRLVAIAQIPRAASAGTDREALLAALRTLAEGPADLPGRLASLSFVLPPLEGLEVSQIQPHTQVTLSDRPGRDQDDVAEARVAYVLIAPGAGLPSLGELEGMVHGLHPGATIGEKRAWRGAQGAVLGLSYTWTHPDGTPLVGVTYARALGPDLLIVQVRFLTTDKTMPHRIRTLFEGIRARR